MALPKIKGIETEWSIGVMGKGGYKPAETFYFERMINIIREYFGLFIQSHEESLGEIENIDRINDLDLPGSLSRKLLAHHICNVSHNLLPNGGRLYIDGYHLEYSTAECLSAKTLVAADRAGEAILNLARKILNQELVKEGRELIIHKDNCSRKGNSYGCHENYLVSRKAFDEITNPASLGVGRLASFLVCRQIFTGSGKMGIEVDGKRLSDSVYQISQRADFIETLLSNCTTSNRAIVNNRDEPLADRRRFGRLHIIAGDANLAEAATYMKVGITSIILKMLEDGFLEGDIIINDPVEQIKLVSQDLTCKKPVLETLGGRKLSGLDLNEELFQRAKAYFSSIAEPSAEERDLLQKWQETISDFRNNNQERLNRRFDWKLKQSILDYFLESHGISWKNIGEARIKEGRRLLKATEQLHDKDILYHNIDEEEGLYWDYKQAGEVEELVSREDVINLIKNPPSECRSYFRGRCIGKFFKEIDAADWDKILFKGERKNTADKNFSVFYSYANIEMKNPIWGGKDDVGEILDRAADYEELFKELKLLKQ